MSKSYHKKFNVPFYRLTPGTVIETNEGLSFTVSRLQCLGAYHFTVDTEGNESIALEDVKRVTQYAPGEVLFGNKGETQYVDFETELRSAREKGNLQKRGNRIVFSGTMPHYVAMLYVTRYLACHAKALGYRPWEAINCAAVAHSVLKHVAILRKFETAPYEEVHLPVKKFERFIRQNINRFKTPLKSFNSSSTLD